ncbi:MAG: ABC transporter permease, partial [Bacteroidota bacterium]
AYIFVSIIVALFLGLTVSAEEIYKDRKILKREKFLNLSKSSYLLSKLGILFIISAIQTLLFVAIGNSILEIQGMYFHYWLMLFTVSCLANVMGLNISASFNSAVTIYILIPLLIVPQMILGGAMFSYEKLNRAIGGGFGNRVPVIAEIVPSRWAYEGLVVQQFIGNRYESELYELNRAVSDYLYKRSFYIPKLKEKLSRVQHYLLNPTDSLREDFRYSLSLLQYEIGQEVEEVPSLPFKDQEQLNEQQFDAVVLENTNSYLKSLTAYYNSNYNYVRHLKDSIILDRTSSPLLRKSYRMVMDNHHNEHVEDMARKTFNDIKIIEHQGRLIRQIDPIYFNPAPQHLFDFRAHFFSPNKHFLGRFYNAFYFNIAALWIFSILLYVALYFDLLKKFLDLFSNLRFKRSQAAK